jgi:hypothetical protein
MAGDWIKVRCNLAEDPRVFAMAVELDIPELHVVGMLFRVWAWADAQSLDGNALSVTESYLDRMVLRPGFSLALRNVGWLEGRNGLLSFPRFAEHNGQTAKGRALVLKRVTAHRNAPSVTNVTPPPLPEKRREEKKREDPDPSSRPAAGEGVKVEEVPPVPPPPPPPPNPKPVRERNLVLDALAACGGSDPLQIPPSAWSGIAKHLADIRAVCPTVTPEEIARRSANFRTRFNRLTLTPGALAKYWADCDKPAEETPESIRGRALFA